MYTIQKLFPVRTSSLNTQLLYLCPFSASPLSMHINFCSQPAPTQLSTSQEATTIKPTQVREPAN